MNALALIVTLAVGLFGGAAGAALITGMFNRPKVHADTVAALAAADTGRGTSSATVTEIIQRAAGGLVEDMERQLDALGRRVDAAEKRADAAERRADAAARRVDEGDRWRRAAEALFAQHGRWEQQVSDLLAAAHITSPPTPPLRPALTPPEGIPT